MNENRKILVADDVTIVVAMVSDILKRAAFDVVTASDGIEAVQRVYQEMPDLVLLDIFMPRMNGYQVCRLLKNDPVVAHIPVVILTASDSRSDEFWSLQTGADGFIVKGAFKPSDLLALVHRLLPAQRKANGSGGEVPPPEEILSKVSALMDHELYAATVERIQLKTILENLTEGILTLSTGRLITSANRALCTMLGISEIDVMGRPCGEVMENEAAKATLAAFEQALLGMEPEPRDTTIRHPSGSLTPVAVSAAVLRDYLGKTVGCVCLFQDITRRKQVESLYDELRLLTKMKDDLTHMIVHDLRTPLTGILGGLQSLELFDDATEEERQELMSMAFNGGQTLLGMINDLLDISKMEDGSMKLEYSELSATELINKVLGQVGALAREKNLELNKEVAADVKLAADGEKLRRTIVNLVGNAIKFTPVDGSITVAARRGDDADEIVFSVTDTGEGIPDEAFGRIFEKFGQVEGRKSGQRMSTGLGLTFCKMAVEAHGGRIWVESELGKGSTFLFAIPANLGGEETAAAAPSN